MNDGLGLLTGDPNGGTPPRPEPERGSGAWKILLVLAILAVLVVGFLNADRIKNALEGAPEDYSGEGSGEVLITVEPGMGGLDVGRLLAKEDVVASSAAFYEVTRGDERATSIQPGTFTLKKKMSARAAFEALLDRSNRVEARVTIPEGTRVDDIAAIIVKNTEFSEDDVNAAIEDTGALGLPEIAKGNLEGYLFPDTYFVEPGINAQDLLKRMVAQTMRVLEELDVDKKARALGMTTEEIVTIASILEWEVNNDEDFAKASRVIQNRLEVGEALRMDSTVHYVSGRRGDIYTTDEERAADNPYNTYKYAGLPPGPIGSPGRAALQAALNPAEGKWMYFVADSETGETRFTNTYSEHKQACRDFGFEC